MQNRCSKRAAKESSEIIPVTFQLGSIREALPLGPFDGILSNYVFHWFERAERAEMMQQMYDSLKPGGRLTFLLNTNETESNVIVRDIFRLTEPNLDEESASGIKWTFLLCGCSTAVMPDLSLNCQRCL